MSYEDTEWLRGLAFKECVSLFGAADIRSIKNGFLLSSSETDKLNFAVSIGVRISPAVLLGITSRPTLLYKWHYQQANQFLDKVAFILTQKIMEKGYQALPVPASQVVDWVGLKGHVSHRVVGEAAGLGWRGRNNLLVHPKYGAQIRLVTVLTDMALESNPSIENQCGTCRKCVTACPAGALGETFKDYNINKCNELLAQFSKERGIGVRICGICVKACSGVKESRHEG